MGRRPNYDRINRIVELKATGMSNAEIAKSLGVTRQAIYECLKNNEERVIKDIMQELDAMQYRIDEFQRGLSFIRKRVIDSSIK